MTSAGKAQEIIDEKVETVLGGLATLGRLSKDQTKAIANYLRHSRRVLETAVECTLMGMPSGNLWLLDVGNQELLARRRQVIFVLGTSYSGSTLLNQLLDTQPGVRGLSEANHWFDESAGAYCAHCNAPLRECVRWRQFAFNLDFYETAFAAYPDSHTLVNCAKHPSLAFQLMPLPPDGVVCRAVVLYKYPHEFAWSFIHHEGATLEKSFREWIGVNRYVFRYLNIGRDPREAPLRKHYPCPFISEQDVLALPYRELALEPAKNLRRICQKWGIAFDVLAAASPWSRPKDTCMVGGNMALFAQRTGDAQFFSRENARYLQAKYVGQRNRIFLDAHWRKDADFRHACRRMYAREVVRQGVDALCETLGSSWRTVDLVRDLDGCG